MFVYGIILPVSDPIADPLKDPILGEAEAYAAQVQAVRDPQCVGSPSCDVASGSPDSAPAFDSGLD